MNDKRQGSWFQIHLSTGIVLMFAAAVAVWINIAWPEAAVADLDYSRMVGFPFAFVGRLGKQTEILYDELVMNFVFWTGVLCYVGFICERRIRRREACKSRQTSLSGRRR